MKLPAGFDLARAGNFPSVASNVLAAFVLSSPAGSGWPAPGTLGWAVVAGCLLYAGGATLNDVADSAFDARHRPERAIPRQVVTRRAAAWLGAGEMVLGLALLLAGGAAPFYAGALVATILAYDWIHKRWSGSVVLMAGCRVLLALSVASFPGQEAGGAFYLWVAALFVYIVTLSAIARGEHRSTAPARIGRNVGRLLAFIPLLDAVALAAVGAWLPAMACAAAVPIGRWAQRVAAST
jgi:4-hydroxybenzoate polyprenyltransferase